MIGVEFRGVEVDYCDACGVWLDQGELELLLSSEGIEWQESGASVVVRYEGLVDDPVAELSRATDQIRPVPRDRIVAAIEACQAETLLQTRKGLRRRIRAATSGDWRNHLTAPHLDIFRERHADRIRALGYEVR